MVGSQAMHVQAEVCALAAALRALGVPLYCAGMARGLLGDANRPRLMFRHARGKALKQADLVSRRAPRRGPCARRAVLSLCLFLSRSGA